MVTPHHRPRHRARALALAARLLCAGALLAPAVLPAAHAQTASAARAYQIPAGPLPQAIGQFARQSSVYLSGVAELAAGKTSPGLNGRYSVQQGLQTLLQGTGLEAVRQNDGSYALRESNTLPEVSVTASAIRTASAGQLPEVTVTAEADSSGLTENTGSYTTRSTSAATGLNLSLRETPQSVTVVTRQRLDDQNLNSLNQVLAQVPGLSAHVGPMDAAINSTVYSRGYLLNSFQIDGATASPSTFSEGSGGWGGAGGLDTALYDSVTVVRGATGLLSGAGNPSGSINLVRKRPTDTFQASLSASLGRWDKYRAVADVGGPLNAAGTVRGRVVALYDEGKSWAHHYEHDKKTIYGVLDADLGDSTLLSLTLERHDTSNKGGTAGTNFGFPFVSTDGTRTSYARSNNNTTDWSYLNEEKTAASLALEHRLNADWKGRLRYGYTNLHLQGKDGAITGVAPDGTATSMRLRNDLAPNKTHSHEVDARLEGAYSLWGRKHDLVAGFNGYDIEYKGALSHSSRGYQLTGNTGWDGNWNSIPLIGAAIDTQQYGLFLATRLRPTEKLSVIAGARWSHWKTRSEDVPGVTGYDPANSVFDSRKKSGVLVPYAGIVYDLSQSLSAYASYTEIFNPQYQYVQDASGRILDPEEGKNYELGLKGEWFNGRLNASAAVFETRKDNMAVRDGNNLTPSGGDAYRGASGTKGRGWELEVSGEPARGWQLQAGYARVITKDANGDLLTTADVPKHSFKLFTTWKPAQLTGLTLGGGVQWQSEIYENSSWYSAAQLVLYRQKSYAVASLLAQYRFDDHWHLSVNLNNVFDKTYRTAVTRHEYGAPRNLQATLRYQF